MTKANLTGSITLEDLQKQLVATEAELESVKAHAARCDGVIQLLKHFILDIESNKEVTTESSEE